MALTPDASGNLSANFTITLTSSGDKINGTLRVPASVLTGGPLTGSATITGGTGAYAGATGSFPNLTGSLSLVTGSLTFSGAGTINTGGTGGPPAPVITEVLDAGSYTGNIAQGSIFVVKGTGLSASGFTQLAFPLPTTAGGVKITFTPVAGGAGTDAYLVYLYNLSGVNQLAAVLPSRLAAGNYNATVTYDGNPSAPFAVRVVQRKIGLITADSSGSGLAVIQNYISPTQLDIDRFTTFSSSGYTFSPAKPGQTLIAWATGMGPVSSGDNTASPGFDFAASGVDVQVIVGGMSIRPLYAGRAPGLAGADQINFTLPPNVPTGCTVSFQISVGGVLSNPSFIAIAPNAGASACVQSGFTTAQLQQYDQGASHTAGHFILSQVSQTVPQLGTGKFNAASGRFIRYSGFQLGALVEYQAQVSTTGACTVVHTVSGSMEGAASAASITGLDAGAVTLSGPTGSNLSNTPFTQEPRTNFYSINLGAEGISIPGSVNATLVPGTYTVNGGGGKDIGRFSAPVTLGSPLTVTGGLPSLVVRSAGLPLAWTGGNASDPVQIIGSATRVTGSGTNETFDMWVFTCTTTAGARTFTVPASILTQLPAVSASDMASGTGFGSLGVYSGVIANFTAPLVAGGNIDTGAFVSLVGIGTSPAYQ
jgi:uncharacterized protein (TIGR03437 family)